MSASMPGLLADAHLADAIAPPASAAPSAAPQHVLLTGVTGFLGGEIAVRLLTTTAAHVYCLVRDSHDTPARLRLAGLCTHLGLDPGRITLAAGDVTCPLLGVPDLVERVDTIIHCGAQVHLFAPYGALRTTNVLGCRAVLQFASVGLPKRIHFVSTIGVFLSPHYRSQTVREDEAVAGEDGLRNGYAQSKWVADLMMRRARERGFAVSIYRPAFVGWHSASGRYGAHDLVALLLIASAKAGCAPRLDLQINATPVDYVASALVAALPTPMGMGKTYHLANQEAVRFVEVASMGQLAVVDPAHWQSMVAQKAPEFSGFAHRVCLAEADEASGSVELRFQHNRRYSNETLRSVLGARFIPPPPVNAAYVGTLWARLRKDHGERPRQEPRSHVHAAG
jgi:myxalamid-type nonribosomal peptide synthetase MxaA